VNKLTQIRAMIAQSGAKTVDELNSEFGSLDLSDLSEDEQNIVMSDLDSNISFKE
jgi:hypothetical protein